MKKSVSLMTLSCAFLCLLAITGCHKSVTTPASSLQSKITGKWTVVNALLTTTNYGVTQKDTIPFTSADYIEFKADSTVSIMATGAAYNGRWHIDGSTLYVTGTTFIDNPTGWQLPILDQHNLQLDYSQTNPDTFIEEKMNLTR